MIFKIKTDHLKLDYINEVIVYRVMVYKTDHLKLDYINEVIVYRVMVYKNRPLEIGLYQRGYSVQSDGV